MHSVRVCRNFWFHCCAIDSKKCWPIRAISWAARLGQDRACSLKPIPVRSFYKFYVLSPRRRSVVLTLVHRDELSQLDRAQILSFVFRIVKNRFVMFDRSTTRGKVVQFSFDKKVVNCFKLICEGKG